MAALLELGDSTFCTGVGDLGGDRWRENQAVGGKIGVFSTLVTLRAILEGKERILRAKNLVADAFSDPIHSAGCRQWLACLFAAIYSFWWFGQMWFGHYFAQILGK